MDSDRGEDEFERLLLASARSDVEPPDGDAAWSRFAGALRSVASVAILEPGKTDEPVPGPSDRAADRARAAGRAAHSVKWLIATTAGVAGLTAAVWILHPRAPTPRQQQPLAPIAAAPEPAGPAPGPMAAPAALNSSGHIDPMHSRRGAPAARASAAGPQTAIPSPASSLAVEVERIETARTALSLGDYAEAIRLIDGYQREFPRSALIPDAEVIAVEAAAARGDLAERTERARRFLSLYPNDPHAARVRWLADHPGGSGHK